jgi:polar amino acid transport system substrate-binding protein
MMIQLTLCLTLIAVFIAQNTSNAAAQHCGREYIFKEGDSLADIARSAYGSPSQWTVLFYANQNRLGPGASFFAPGMAITIPCVQEEQRALSPAPPAADSKAAQQFELSPILKRIEFLTADNFAPYTDRSLSQGGLTTALITAGMMLVKEQAKDKFDFRINWVNDWPAHLDPLLSTKAFDAGFPWSRPDCERPEDLDDNGKLRCSRFLFSDPIYENVTPIFVKRTSPITFNKDEEILGKNVCRPRGHFTYLFEKGGRRWLKEKKIVLIQPQTVEDCFRLLRDGSVDAVAVSDFVGRTALASLGMQPEVRIAQRPISIDAFHVIVPKTHPNALSILYYVNSSLAKLHESGDFDKIVDQQISAFWQAQETNKSAAAK